MGSKTKEIILTRITIQEEITASKILHKTNSRNLEITAEVLETTLTEIATVGIQKASGMETVITDKIILQTREGQTEMVSEDNNSK
jgi:hypothetical protein